MHAAPDYSAGSSVAVGAHGFIGCFNVMGRPMAFLTDQLIVNARGKRGPGFMTLKADPVSLKLAEISLQVIRLFQIAVALKTLKLCMHSLDYMYLFVAFGAIFKLGRRTLNCQQEQQGKYGHCGGSNCCLAALYKHLPLSQIVFFRQNRFPGLRPILLKIRINDLQPAAATANPHDLLMALKNGKRNKEY
jgi:hypothetical protein